MYCTTLQVSLSEFTFKVYTTSNVEQQGPVTSEPSTLLNGKGYAAEHAVLVIEQLPKKEDYNVICRDRF